MQLPGPAHRGPKHSLGFLEDALPNHPAAQVVPEVGRRPRGRPDVASQAAASARALRPNLGSSRHALPGNIEVLPAEELRGALAAQVHPFLRQSNLAPRATAACLANTRGAPEADLAELALHGPERRTRAEALRKCGLPSLLRALLHLTRLLCKAAAARRRRRRRRGSGGSQTALLGEDLEDGVAAAGLQAQGAHACSGLCRR
mmetsp:Transcript_40713/g.131148  ORF Transcript_40713/g.131148 Transcript_40713/m.131148 type:complete len:203 (+) Transcript_40713:1118-1726(+)